ncbi:hypothetical protein BJ322DRAFT_354861 [Thelephora terrestris]|uniref:C2 domain-containing protein n=1 Tax=Thelephora terrestris TaxID=56493 RepID=A0A9P6H560_9AGAM|nr:hypothetical protein BJ322DRAFT_354861 [Thelephora terrestris]
MKTKGREIGTLIAVVLKAKNLPNKRNIGKQDPYCIVTFNEEKQRTKVDKRGGQHPEWDEELRFTLFEEIEDGFGLPADEGGPPPPLPPKDSKGPPDIAGGMFMKIACFADDARDPILIGETSVDLTEVLTKGETDEWFPLSSKLKYAGEVYLELTFWSNEPAPKKRAKSKTPQRTSQYGGAGSFVPFDSSPNRSHPASRMSSSGSDLDHSTTLRTSTSSIQLGLYKAPYEKRASSTNLSVADSVTTEFNNLGVSEVRPRRDTFPPINQPPRATSAQGFQHQYINGHGHNEQDQQPVYPVAQTHQPAYENTQSTLQSSSFQQQQSRGPRYSLPTPQNSSGVVTSSGFVPLNQWRQDPPLPVRTGPTPAPGSYGMPRSVVSHHTGFAPMPTPTPAPSNFLTTSSSLPFQHGYHSPHHSMSYSLPPLPSTIPSQTIPQQYPHTLPPNPPPPLQLTGSPIAEHKNTPNTPSPPQDAYSQLQGEQSVSNPNSRPLPQPSVLARRRSTLPVPPGGGGITTSPTSSPSRPESVYSGGNYQQSIQPIQYNNIPPPPPLPSHFNAAPPQIQSHITGQAPPLPPPLPQRSLVHSHSHSYSLPNPPQPRATNGQQGLPFPPVQQNSQHNLPVPPVKQSTWPSPPAAPPPWRLALPQPPSLPNPPTQQPIYVPPPPPLPPSLMPSYHNQLPQPPMQHQQVHYAPADGSGYHPPQNGALYQQPTGTVWNYH